MSNVSDDRQGRDDIVLAGASNASNGLASGVASMVFIGVPLAGLLLLVEWVIARYLLHGQMGWLVYVPIAFVVALALMAVERLSVIAMLAAFSVVVTALLVGPFIAKRQQLAAEDEFATRVNDIFGSDSSLVDVDPNLTADEENDVMIQFGWDVCYALDSLGSVSQAVMIVASATGETFTSKGYGELEAAVRLADELLC